MIGVDLGLPTAQTIELAGPEEDGSKRGCVLLPTAIGLIRIL